MKRKPSRLLVDTAREIRRTVTRFLSLLILSALAVCFLAGLRAAAPDMKLSADAYFDQQKLMDLHILSTLGLTKDDISALGAQPDILLAEGAYTVDATMAMESRDLVVKVLSYKEGTGVNIPALKEGRLPQAPNECLVEPLLLEESGLSIGDTISLNTGEGTYKDALSVQEATIVGVATSPLYISIDRGSSSLGTGKVSAYIMLPDAAFSMDYYTDAYLLVDGAEKLETYSDEYDDLMETCTKALKPLAWERSQLRLEEANQQISKAEEALAEGEKESQEKLQAGQDELDAARKELDDGWAKYREGAAAFQAESAAGQKKLDDAQAQLDATKKQLDAGEKAYADGVASLEASRPALEQARRELDAGWAEYNAGYTQYQLGLSLYQAGAAAMKAEAASRASAQASTQAAAQTRSIADAEAKKQATQAEAERPGSYYWVYQKVYAQVYAQTYPSIYDKVYNSLYGQILTELENSPRYAALKEQKKELDAAKAQLDAAKAQLDAGEAEYRKGLQQLESGKQTLENTRRQLDYGWQEYYKGLTSLQEGRETLVTQLEQGQKELDQAREKLEKGEEEYSKGYETFQKGKEDAEAQLNDARKEVEQAKRDVKLLEEGQWYILDRNTNVGYASYSMDADRMGSLATIFPLIFFLVAALVCLSTMTRMVEEQRTTIGGLKALGFSKRSIAVKYVGYGFIASAGGALVGLAVGLTLLPWIICRAWLILYSIGEIVYSFEPATSLLACAASIGTVTISALAACFSTLSASPAELMRPKAPPMGKRILLERITPFWKRLSFHYKITLRNLFRYKKRFWMTVIGIGGCAALIVTAFGLRGSILGVMEKQYDEIYHYTAQVGLVDKVTPLEEKEVEDTFSQSSLVSGYLPCRTEAYTAQSETFTADCYLQTTESLDALAPFITLRHRTNDDPVTLPNDGAVITEKLAILLDVKPGDTITLDGEKRVSIRVADITEHYIQHYIYMSDAYYQQVFGQPPEDNTILVDLATDAQEVDALESQLVSLDGVTSLSLITDIRDTFTSSLESIDYAVILIIVCAAALAFVVLLNLTNINITERMRELATLKVLGFYDRELSSYVYRENVILTVFGVAMGMVLGKLLHQWLVLTVEIDMLMFGRFLNAPSYLWAALLTAAFSLLVNLSAHRKLKSLDMVESLKSVE
ncbi:MAG: FtsX-like permease family protein [Evtepia sp.]|uniref:FtsX-like permease family protein n=1 Tax=Evtepia sp. TaxID=2773933 RepID=UPI002A74A033|nr:FtsX-like permease family protein [Evtepia sp.]MDY3014976.1 FtsX-like permease family protein [Evtepia sp.]